MLSMLCRDAELRVLEPDWTALWRRAGAAPFQAPAWLLPWWDVFGTGRPIVAMLRDDEGVLRGLLPLYLLQEDRACKLLPFGVSISDRIDALIDPAAAPDAAARLLAAALDAAAEAGATECWLPDLSPDAALRTALVPAGWDATESAAEPCPVLRLGADLRSSVPAGMLRDVRQARHRAARLGGWTAGLAADPAARWPAFAALHASRWGVSGDALAFHAAAVPRLAEAGMLRLYEVYLSGRLGAAYYTLAHGSRLLFYLSAYDAGFAHVSPGTLLLGYVAEQATAEGIVELDFLRGREAYKYAWGAIDRPGFMRTLRPNPLGLALAGRLAPRVALARLALEGRDMAASLGAVAGYARGQALAELAGQAQAVAPMLREAGRGHRPDAGIPEIAGLFDAAVRQSPEASVAAWSLGDAAVLAEATDELVAWLHRERLIWPQAEVIDVGCGIGRVAAALAPHVAAVRGLDVSAAMVEEARKRHPGLHFEVTDGQGLATVPDPGWDLVLAVDSFPYLVQAGGAERHVADAARRLRPGGALVILNLSYRDDPAADGADARRWAASHRLHLTHAGERPFTLWDGAAWVLRAGCDPAE